MPAVAVCFALRGLNHWLPRSSGQERMVGRGGLELSPQGAS